MTWRQPHHEEPPPEQTALFNRWEYSGNPPDEPDPRAPEGYYRQSREHAQLAFPGMEMTPHDHARALGDLLGAAVDLRNRVHVHNGNQYRLHTITIRRRSSRNPSMLHWWGHSGGMGAGWARPYHPGEIDIVHSSVSGDAYRMLDLGNRLHLEHPDYYTRPRHSVNRTRPGLTWSRDQMERRGEEIW